MGLGKVRVGVGGWIVAGIRVRRGDLSRFPEDRRKADG